MNTVLRKLKHIFIPHKHNDYTPHFFREVSVISITVIAIVLLSISASSVLYIQNTNMTATVLPSVLVDLTNNARVSDNEQTLTRSPVLDAAAQLKVADMARFGYFAHTSPAGVTPWHWFEQAGYTFKYAGENLAIDFTESADVENAWLNSPTHKANILGAHFTEIGIATADGTYQGHPTTYVVQMFGAPAAVAVDEPKESAPAPLPKQPKAPAPKADASVSVALAPSVKGESIAANQNLQTITDTKEFVSVKNTDTTEAEAAVPASAPKYSSWYERFLFMAPTYTNRIYAVFIWIVLGALCLMTVIEVRRQRAKNIAYGVLLLVIMLCLVYINKSMFVTSFLA